MGNKSNFFLRFFRKASILIISLILSIWILITFALTFPSSPPSWESSVSWLITTYFDKIFQNCWTWKVLQWYNPTTREKICVNL